MNNFKALTVAGLLAGSVSANAAYINLPESVVFDINDVPTSFEDDLLTSLLFEYDYSFDDGREETETFIPITRFFLESENYYSSLDSEGAFDAGIILAYFFIGAGNEFDVKEGKERVTSAILGETYKFDYEAIVYHENYDCSGVDCGESNEVLSGSMLVSFFDGSVQEVPVGPTAPLLAAGLVGLWLRRKAS